MARNVLIATQNNELGELIKLSLEENPNYRLQLVSASAEAIRLFSAIKFDMIILDGELEGQPLQPLESTFREHNDLIKLIIVPPKNDPKHPAMQGTHPDGLLSRPFFIDDLREMVEKIFETVSLPIVKKPEPPEETAPIMLEDEILQVLAQGSNDTSQSLQGGIKVKVPSSLTIYDQLAQDAKRKTVILATDTELSLEEELEILLAGKPVVRGAITPLVSIPSSVAPTAELAETVLEITPPELDDDQQQALLASVIAQLHPDADKPKELSENEILLEEINALIEKQSNDKPIKVEKTLSAEEIFASAEQKAMPIRKMKKQEPALPMEGMEPVDLEKELEKLLNGFSENEQAEELDGVAFFLDQKSELPGNGLQNTEESLRAEQEEKPEEQVTQEVLRSVIAQLEYQSVAPLDDIEQLTEETQKLIQQAEIQPIETLPPDLIPAVAVSIAQNIPDELPEQLLKELSETQAEPLDSSEGMVETPTPLPSLEELTPIPTAELTEEVLPDDFAALLQEIEQVPEEVIAFSEEPVQLPELPLPEAIVVDSCVPAAEETPAPAIISAEIETHPEEPVQEAPVALPGRYRTLLEEARSNYLALAWLAIGTQGLDSISGVLDTQDVKEIQETLLRQWEPGGTLELVRFIQLKGHSGRCLLYAAPVQEGLILAAVFERKVPLSQARIQTAHVIQKILSSKDVPLEDKEFLSFLGTEAVGEVQETTLDELFAETEHQELLPVSENWEQEMPVLEKTELGTLEKKIDKGKNPLEDTQPIFIKENENEAKVHQEMVERGPIEEQEAEIKEIPPEFQESITEGQTVAVEEIFEREEEPLVEMVPELEMEIPVEKMLVEEEKPLVEETFEEGIETFAEAVPEIPSAEEIPEPLAETAPVAEQRVGIEGSFEPTSEVDEVLQEMLQQRINRVDFFSKEYMSSRVEDQKSLKKQFNRLRRTSIILPEPLADESVLEIPDEKIHVQFEHMKNRQNSSFFKGFEKTLQSPQETREDSTPQDESDDSRQTELSVEEKEAFSLELEALVSPDLIENIEPVFAETELAVVEEPAQVEVPEIVEAQEVGEAKVIAEFVEEPASETEDIEAIPTEMLSFIAEEPVQAEAATTVEPPKVEAVGTIPDLVEEPISETEDVEAMLAEMLPFIAEEPVQAEAATTVETPKVEAVGTIAESAEEPISETEDVEAMLAKMLPFIEEEPVQAETPTIIEAPKVEAFETIAESVEEPISETEDIEAILAEMLPFIEEEPVQAEAATSVETPKVEAVGKIAESVEEPISETEDVEAMLAKMLPFIEEEPVQAETPTIIEAPMVEAFETIAESVEEPISETEDIEAILAEMLPFIEEEPVQAEIPTIIEAPMVEAFETIAESVEVPVSETEDIEATLVEMMPSVAEKPVQAEEPTIIEVPMVNTVEVKPESEEDPVTEAEGIDALLAEIKDSIGGEAAVMSEMKTQLISNPEMEETPGDLDSPMASLPDQSMGKIEKTELKLPGETISDPAKIDLILREILSGLEKDLDVTTFEMAPAIKVPVEETIADGECVVEGKEEEVHPAEEMVADGKSMMEKVGEHFAHRSTEEWVVDEEGEAKAAGETIVDEESVVKEVETPFVSQPMEVLAVNEDAEIPLVDRATFPPLPEEFSNGEDTTSGVIDDDQILNDVLAQLNDSIVQETPAEEAFVEKHRLFHELSSLNNEDLSTESPSQKLDEDLNRILIISHETGGYPDDWDFSNAKEIETFDDQTNSVLDNVIEQLKSQNINQVQLIADDELADLDDDHDQSESTMSEDQPVDEFRESTKPTIRITGINLPQTDDFNLVIQEVLAQLKPAEKGAQTVETEEAFETEKPEEVKGTLSVEEPEGTTEVLENEEFDKTVESFVLEIPEDAVETPTLNAPEVSEAAPELSQVDLSEESPKTIEPVDDLLEEPSEAITLSPEFETSSALEEEEPLNSVAGNETLIEKLPEPAAELDDLAFLAELDRLVPLEAVSSTQRVKIEKAEAPSKSDEEEEDQSFWDMLQEIAPDRDDQEVLTEGELVEDLVFPWDNEPEEMLDIPGEESHSDQTLPTIPSHGESLPEIDFSTQRKSMNQFAYTCVLIPQLSSYNLSIQIAKCLREWVPGITQAFGWELERMAVQPTYLQWTIWVGPEVSQGNMVRQIRQRTSQRIFDLFPELKKLSQTGNFWAPGYLVVSGSQPPAPEFVDDFIQKTRRARQPGLA